MSRILVVAPHPDDETLGCGGTLLRHAAHGASMHWLVVTAMSESHGFAAERIAARAKEIDAVAAAYPFSAVHQAGLPTTRLDTVPMADLIDAIGKVMHAARPDTVYVPYRNDAHSDHAAVFDAAVACCKSFRNPNIRQVYAYETLSETEFGMRPDDPGFRPNLFVDMSPWLDRKLEILHLFAGEMGRFPFPRSDTTVRALAALRGSQAGVQAAEAFMVLKEIR